MSRENIKVVHAIYDTAWCLRVIPRVSLAEKLAMRQRPFVRALKRIDRASTFPLHIGIFWSMEGTVVAPQELSPDSV
jgi:hypothetical protein